MSISLVKGEKIDLSKGNSGLSKIMVGLGWDPAEKKAGILGGLFGGNSNVDCDASALLLNAEGKLESNKEVIYYANKSNKTNSVVHQGDNITGEGEGDDEQIMLNLGALPSSVQKVVFVVNIYDCINRKQDFGMIKNAFIRVVDMSGNKEICKYNLSENYAGKTSLIVGEIYRSGQEWKFGAIGQATNDSTITEIVKKYK